MEKQQVEEQLLDLYDKFPDVKKYYDFVFNPKEDKIVGEAKAKISNEYFPIKTKRAKLRRSTAQKYIKQFVMLGVDPFLIADLMLYNIETAQKYSAKRDMKYQVSFYKSMLNSLKQAIDYIVSNGVTVDFRDRLFDVAKTAKLQRWENYHAFDDALEILQI